MAKMNELYEKVTADSTLQVKFAEIMKEAEAAGEKATNEKLASFAKEAGYDITVEEMQTFFQGIAENEKKDLSDAELDMVAGGKSAGLLVGSIATLGLGCALASLYGLKSNTTCDKEMDIMLDQPAGL